MSAPELDGDRGCCSRCQGTGLTSFGGELCQDCRGTGHGHEPACPCTGSPLPWVDPAESEMLTDLWRQQ